MGRHETHAVGLVLIKGITCMPDSVATKVSLVEFKKQVIVLIYLPLKLESTVLKEAVFGTVLEQGLNPW